MKITITTTVETQLEECKDPERPRFQTQVVRSVRSFELVGLYNNYSEPVIVSLYEADVKKLHGLLGQLIKSEDL